MRDDLGIVAPPRSAPETSRSSWAVLAKFAPINWVLAIFARMRSAPVKFALMNHAVRASRFDRTEQVKSARDADAASMFALNMLASIRFVPVRSIPVRFEWIRFMPEKFSPESSAPTRQV